MPVQYEVYNGALKSSLWFDDDRHVYTWTAENIPPIKREPHMVAVSDCATKVVLATVRDWESKSRWFYEANESQFEVTDDIRAKVAELTDGLTDPEDKIAALTLWVADNCRYVGTSRGQHEGFTLHKGIETFRDRGGVCKDKAGMLVTMLRALGHESYAALTMAGSRVEDIPADQFNHTVTVLRNPDGSFRILDPTWAPLSRELWSSREALQGLVYGTPAGETLTLSPYFEPQHNRLLCRSTATLSDAGTLRTEISLDMHGYPCTYLRRTVGRTPAPEQRGLFEAATRIAHNQSIDALHHTDPYDYSTDSTVRMTISADDYVVTGAGLRLFRMPLLTHPLSDFLSPDAFYDVSAEKREHGLRLRATRHVVYEETLTLPEGWSVRTVPAALSLESGSAALSFEATTGDGEFSYRFELALKNHIVPPEDYVEYKKAIDAMTKLSREWIVCSTGQPVTEHAATQ